MALWNKMFPNWRSLKGPQEGKPGAVPGLRRMSRQRRDSVSTRPSTSQSNASSFSDPSSSMLSYAAAALSEPDGQDRLSVEDSHSQSAVIYTVTDTGSQDSDHHEILTIDPGDSGFPLVMPQLEIPRMETPQLNMPLASGLDTDADETPTANTQDTHETINGNLAVYKSEDLDTANAERIRSLREIFPVAPVLVGRSRHKFEPGLITTCKFLTLLSQHLTHLNEVWCALASSHPDRAAQQQAIEEAAERFLQTVFLLEHDTLMKSTDEKCAMKVREGGECKTVEFKSFADLEFEYGDMTVASTLVVLVKIRQGFRSGASEDEVQTVKRECLKLLSKGMRPCLMYANRVSQLLKEGRHDSADGDFP